MSEAKLKEKILIVRALANAGLKVTMDCFTLMAFETYGVYTSPEALKKYKSASQAISAMANSLVLIGEDIAQANAARALIYTLYPESIGEEKVEGKKAPKKEINMPRQVLLLLISLAEKYKALATVAEKFAAEACTFEDLKEKAMEVNYVYGKAKDWATKYPKEYRPLTTGNNLIAIMNLVDIIQKQIEAGLVEEEVTATSETQVVELPEEKRRAG